MLAGTVEDFVDSTCCEKKKRENLYCGVGQRAKNPSFQMEMCEKKCEVCGASKLGINKCNIWNKCELEADVLEWFYAD